jgi:hypothetical protein
MKKELVIAAHSEDYSSWITKIDKSIQKIIYRKGDLNYFDGEIKMPKNVGRDVHTFFSHICENYYNLSDVIFFSQDYPFDHIENYIEIINSDEKIWKENAIVSFGGYFGFHWNSVRTPTPRAGIMHTLYPSRHFSNNDRIISCLSNGHPHDRNPNINVNKVWSILFDEPTPEFYEFVPGGHFGITKEQITKRSIEFYKEIINLLESDETMPWNVERLECYIFNEKFKSKK